MSYAVLASVMNRSIAALPNNSLGLGGIGPQAGTRSA